MKHIFLFLILFVEISASQPADRRGVDAEILDVMDRRIITEPMEEVIRELEKKIELSHTELLEATPPEVIQKILACENPKDMYNLSAEIHV